MSVIGNAEGIKHGTWGGYKQHLYRKVDVCDACREASRERSKKLKARKKGPADERPGDEPKPRFRSEAQAAWYGGQHPMHGASKSRPITAGESPLPPGTIRGRDLDVGHVIDFLGRGYPVERFESYHGSLKGCLGRAHAPPSAATGA